MSAMSNASPLRYALFLRGVNVGGVTVKSADLKACLAAAGFEDVRTVLASGNALVTSHLAADGVKKLAESAIKDEFDRDIPVIVRTQVQVAALVEQSPYDADSTTHHAYAILVESQEAADTLFAVTPTSEDETTAVGERALYWWCPRGSSLNTRASKDTTRAAKAMLMTTRNVRTLRRLIAG